jgi:anti-sigma factor RsiW
MDCEKLADEQLQADKMDLLYGESDTEVRRRVEAHLAGCAACRQEMQALRGVRQDLGAWRLRSPRPSFSPRGLVVPRWLAAAAAVVLALGASIGAFGYVSVRRALVSQEARARALEQRQQQAALDLAALRAAAERPVAFDADRVLPRLDARIDEKVRASEQRQGRAVDLRFADWADHVEAQRRVDLARVAAGLSYLDGRHGEQVARTNELMGYVLETAAARKR